LFLLEKVIIVDFMKRTDFAGTTDITNEMLQGRPPSVARCPDYHGSGFMDYAL